MITETISESLYNAIADAAKTGSYTSAEVTLLTPSLNTTKNAIDASYLVVESAYTITIIRLDVNGVPDAILDS